MSKLHFKGLSESIDYLNYDKLLDKILIDFNLSRDLELTIPEKDDVYYDSRFKELEQFREYFLQLVKIATTQNLVKYKASIIDYKDSQQSVLKAVQELIGADDEVTTWKDKVFGGSYSVNKTDEKSKNLFNLFKYELYFDYTKRQRWVIKELWKFLNENYSEQLTKINSSSFNSDSVNFLNPNSENEVNSNDNLLTIEEVCKLLKKSRTTIHNYTKQGIITKYTIGGAVFYFKDEIIKIIKNSN